MLESLTPGAHRAVERAEARARLRGSPVVEPFDLLGALVDEPECRAVALMVENGLPPEQLHRLLGIEIPPDLDQSITGGEFPQGGNPPPLSAEFRAVLGDAVLQARSIDRNRLVGTEHLLGGLLTSLGPAAEALQAAGLVIDRILEQLGSHSEADAAPIPMSEDIAPLDLAGPAEAVDLARILDAAANRAGEGLRVVEDYIRFVLDDPMLTLRLKAVRHRYGEAVRGLELPARIGARDTLGDVGTHITIPSEQVRENPRAVLAANFRRITEALRSLEEYAKLLDVWLAGQFEALRYDVYTLEKLTLVAVAAGGALGDARLCLLVGGLPTLGDLTWIVGEALEGGVQVVQLREKNLPDREVLRRAREVRILTAQARARFILNDRPDLARLSGADGVHVGQEDMSLRDARRIVGPQALIGVSTHDREQLERAVLEGAGYLGVGPVFSSSTKEFASLAGLNFVAQAAEISTRPWFAIGGIALENVDAVLESGATRIAVSGAVVHAERPRQAAAALRARLDAAVEG